MEEDIREIARKYAEHIHPTEYQIWSDSNERRRMEGYNRSLKKNTIRFLEWFLKRYCVVEKSRAAELCRLTLEHGDSVDYGLIDGLSDWVMTCFEEQYHDEAEKKALSSERRMTDESRSL